MWPGWETEPSSGSRTRSPNGSGRLPRRSFLAAFLGPAWSAVPSPILWLFRWLLFRVEFGAGLIKTRGDPCWRELTCLYYHHETQPMPNPLSWYFHRLPGPLHRLEVLGSHFAQLVAPLMLFFPQPIASFAGLVIVITQAWLVLSGNFSWLNFVTLVLAASAFDDAALARVVPLEGASTTVVAWHEGLVIAFQGTPRTSGPRCPQAHYGSVTVTGVERQPRVPWASWP
ncbi:lipase maturation factor family protein [Archangium lansingense]|uniref:Lipase maturation factor family protein n=1 Tax=Archangium lansingense TaxID=2995310 RepID=A0ABT4A6J7_9BACT|nr:lipase maturation factor family protein [Archangium lansinium]MCY1077279.1 lipase maturation factor family protein [Archangium lansinium]